MPKQNKIRLNSKPEIFNCEYPGIYNDESKFRLIHKQFFVKDEPLEIIEILWEDYIPSRDKIASIEEGIKELFKLKQRNK